MRMGGCYRFSHKFEYTYEILQLVKICYDLSLSHKKNMRKTNELPCKIRKGKTFLMSSFQKAALF